MEQRKVFRSRVSVLMIILTLPIFVIAVVPIIQYGDYKMLLPLGGILLFIILLLSGIRYVVVAGKLLVKIWFIRTWSINIMDIVSVKRSYNPLSSPAASLKRLCISCSTRGSCLISPVREQEFIETLKAINPHIRVNVLDKKGKWRIQDWDI